MSWSAESSRVPPEVQLRDSLNRAQDGNGATPSTMLDLLDALTSGEVWRKLEDARGRAFSRFTDFVVAPRPHGMGLADTSELHKQLALRHKEEREPYRRQDTADRMAAMRQRVRQLVGEELPQAQRQGRPGKGDGVTFKGDHTHSVEHIVRRLKRDDPELAGRVVRGEVTPNAAALLKGWRKPRIVVTTPDAVARALRKHMSAEDLAQLRELLAVYPGPLRITELTSHE